jgi:hypothetical protein
MAKSINVDPGGSPSTRARREWVPVSRRGPGSPTASILALSDGTTVVTGPRDPNLPGGYIPAVTVGYDPNGTLLWEAFSTLATVWATALPSGDVCATGG